MGTARATPTAPYCRWRQAEALVAAGVPRAEASDPLRTRTSSALGSEGRWVRASLEPLAERARLDLTPLRAASSSASRAYRRPSA